MDIKYLGHSSFLVKGSKYVCFDPFGSIGYEMERVKADLCLISHNHYDHNKKEKVESDNFIIQGQGDCDKEYSLEKISTYHDQYCGAKRGINFVYKLTIDDITFCHLGDFGEDDLNGLAEKIGDCDVLMFPIGGTYTIDYIQANKLVELVKPKIAIPMHYKTDKSNIDIDKLDEFLNICKFEVINKNQEFTLDKKDFKEKTVVFVPESKNF